MPVNRVEHTFTYNRKPDEPPPDVVANLELVRGMSEATLFPYRGRVFTIDPTPVPVGLKLDTLRREWDRLAEHDGSPEALELVFQRAVRIMHRHARPRSLAGVLPWWLRRNRFRTASNAEFTDLMLFFSASRMRSSIRSRLAQAVGTPFSM